MNFVDKYLTGLEAAIHKLSRQDVSAVVEALLVAWRADRQIFVIGNGGSAATASHMMNDINKLTISPGKRRFRGIALTDNMPLITAWGNDAAFADVFAEPLRNLMRKGDVLVVISASGNSPNLLEAVRVARAEFGAQIRDFVNVDDVARANLLALEDARADYGVFNVGGDRRVTVNQFARVMA